MNELEKAAYDYINSDAVESDNMQLAFGDFINGAQWQKERLINKACEWLRKDMEEGVIPYFDEGLVASSTADTLDDFINAFKKHLEEEK